MTGKVIFQALLSLVAGGAFIAVGIYFLSERFLNKINESSSAQTEEVLKKNKFRAKGRLTTLALGAITLVQALLLFTFPLAASWLSLIYLIFIMAAVLVLVIVFK